MQQVANIHAKSNLLLAPRVSVRRRVMITQAMNRQPAAAQQVKVQQVVNGDAMRHRMPALINQG